MWILSRISVNADYFTLTQCLHILFLGREISARLLYLICASRYRTVSLIAKSTIRSLSVICLQSVLQRHCILTTATTSFGAATAQKGQVKMSEECACLQRGIRAVELGKFLERGVNAGEGISFYSPAAVGNAGLSPSCTSAGALRDLGCPSYCAWGHTVCIHNCVLPFSPPYLCGVNYSICATDKIRQLWT